MRFIFLFFMLFAGCEAKQSQNSSQKSAPVPLEKTEIEQIIAKPDFVQGIYLTGYIFASSTADKIMDNAVQAGINTVVFDLKNENGEVFFSSKTHKTKLPHMQLGIIDAKAAIDKIHKKGMRAVVRLVMFQNAELATKYPQYCPQHLAGGAWREDKRAIWLDPSNRDVQEDLWDIIGYIAENKPDGIQLDYVRFPTQGDLAASIFQFQKTTEVDSSAKIHKWDVIADFLRGARKLCEKNKVELAADVFAIVSWQREVDVKNTGQKLSLLSQQLDVIHPMIYSSHFDKNFDHRENVWEEPYDLVLKGTYRTIKNVQKNCEVVPYIQANNWRVTYTKKYLLSQIGAIKDADGKGYILWNAANAYERTLGWIKEYNGR